MSEVARVDTSESIAVPERSISRRLLSKSPSTSLLPGSKRKRHRQKSTVDGDREPRPLPAPPYSVDEHRALTLKLASKAGQGPKIPRSAYTIFIADEKSKLGNSFKGMEISQELARRWKALDAAARQIYVNHAAQEKSRLSLGDQSYVKSDAFTIAAADSHAFLLENAARKDRGEDPVDFASFQKRARTAAKPDAKRAAEVDSVVQKLMVGAGPKKPRTSYQIFAADKDVSAKVQAAVGDVPKDKAAAAASKALGKLWKNTDQSKYKAVAAEEQEKYKTELAVFQKAEEFHSMQEQAHKFLVENAAKQSRGESPESVATWLKRISAEVRKGKIEQRKFDATVLRLVKSAPKGSLTSAPIPAKGAYVLFTQARKGDLEGVPVMEMGKKLAELWKGCEPHEKAQFEKAAKLDMQRYDKELSEFKASDEGQNFAKDVRAWVEAGAAAGKFRPWYIKKYKERMKQRKAAAIEAARSAKRAAKKIARAGQSRATPKNQQNDAPVLEPLVQDPFWEPAEGHWQLDDYDLVRNDKLLLAAAKAGGEAAQALFRDAARTNAKATSFFRPASADCPETALHHALLKQDVGLLQLLATDFRRRRGQQPQSVSVSATEGAPGYVAVSTVLWVMGGNIRYHIEPKSDPQFMLPAEIDLASVGTTLQVLERQDAWIRVADQRWLPLQPQHAQSGQGRLVLEDPELFTVRPTVLAPELKPVSTGFASGRAYRAKKLKKVNLSRGGKEGDQAFVRDVAAGHIHIPGQGSVLSYQAPQPCTLEAMTWAAERGVDLQTLNICRELFGGEDPAKFLGAALRLGRWNLAQELTQEFGKTDLYGLNPLHLLALKASLSDEELLELSKRKASIMKRALENFSVMPVHCACVGPDGARALEVMLGPLGPGAEDLTQDSEQRTLLHYAAAAETPAALEYLLSRGFSANRLATNGITPLMTACIADRPESVRRLLAAGADTLQRCDEKTCFHMAAERGAAAAMRALLEHKPEEPPVVGKAKKKQVSGWQQCLTPSQQNALHVACSKGDEIIATMLLDDAPGSLHKGDRQQRTPLVFAVLNGHTRLASMLLSRRALVDTADLSGNTPLHYALAYGWRESAQLLMSSGHEPDCQNAWKNGPLDIAILKGHIGAVAWFASVSQVSTDRKDSKGRTLVGRACENFAKDKQWNALLHTLVDKLHADVNLPDGSGTLPICAAVAACSSLPSTSEDMRGTIQLLCRAGANVSDSATEGPFTNRSALSLALSGKNRGLVSIILESGAGVGVKKCGETLLHGIVERIVDFTDADAPGRDEEDKGLLEVIREKVMPDVLIQMGQTPDKFGLLPVHRATAQYIVKFTEVKRLAAQWRKQQQSAQSVDQARAASQMQAFGQAAHAFGQPASGGLFGQASANFPASSGGLFGQPPPSFQPGGLFGQSRLFGQPEPSFQQTPSFGQSSLSIGMPIQASQSTTLGSQCSPGLGKGSLHEEFRLATVLRERLKLLLQWFCDAAKIDPEAAVMTLEKPWEKLEEREALLNQSFGVEKIWAAPKDLSSDEQVASLKLPCALERGQHHPVFGLATPLLLLVIAGDSQAVDWWLDILDRAQGALGRQLKASSIYGITPLSQGLSLRRPLPVATLRRLVSKDGVKARRFDGKTSLHVAVGEASAWADMRAPDQAAIVEAIVKAAPEVLDLSCSSGASALELALANGWVEREGWENLNNLRSTQVDLPSAIKERLAVEKVNDQGEIMFNGRTAEDVHVLPQSLVSAGVWYFEICEADAKFSESGRVGAASEACAEPAQMLRPTTGWSGKSVFVILDADQRNLSLVENGVRGTVQQLPPGTGSLFIVLSGCGSCTLRLNKVPPATLRSILPGAPIFSAVPKKGSRSLLVRMLLLAGAGKALKPNMIVKALNLALESGDAPSARLLCRAFAVVNEPVRGVEGGSLPLHIALRNNDVPLVEALLGARANVNSPDPLDGPRSISNEKYARLPNARPRLPLHIAVEDGSDAIVRLLVKARAEVDTPIERWQVHKHHQWVLHEPAAGQPVGIRLGVLREAIRAACARKSATAAEMAKAAEFGELSLSATRDPKITTNEEIEAMLRTCFPEQEPEKEFTDDHIITSGIVLRKLEDDSEVSYLGEDLWEVTFAHTSAAQTASAQAAAVSETVASMPGSVDISSEDAASITICAPNVLLPRWELLRKFEVEALQSILLYALHCAAERQEVESLQILLRAKADPSKLDGRRGELALHHAVRHLNINAMQKLIDAKCPLDQADETPQRATPLFSLVQHALNNKPNASLAISMLLGARASVDLCCSVAGTAALHLAAADRHQQLVVQLLGFKANVQIADLRGRTPLHHAIDAANAAEPSFELERTLLQAHADVNALDKRGRTPLHCAFVKKGRPLDGSSADPVETVTSLCAVEGVRVDIADEFGGTPLLYSAQRGATISSLYLLARGADGSARDVNDNDVLGRAISNNHFEYAITLLSKDAGNVQRSMQQVSIVDRKLKLSDPLTLFRGAVENNRLGLAYLLLDKEFPFHWAIQDALELGQFQLVLTLLSKVNPSQNEVVQRSDEHGRNLLHVLADFPRAMGGQEAVRIAEAFAGRGVKAGDSDLRGRAPLHCAVAAAHLDLAAWLLKAGGDRPLSKRSEDSKQPLHSVCCRGWLQQNKEATHLKFVKLLLPGQPAAASMSFRDMLGLQAEIKSMGGDLAAMDPERAVNVPLVNVAAAGFLEAVTLFIDAKAEVNARDGRGETPLSAALKGGFVSTDAASLRPAWEYMTREGQSALWKAFHVRDQELLEAASQTKQMQFRTTDLTFNRAPQTPYVFDFGAMTQLNTDSQTVRKIRRNNAARKSRILSLVEVLRANGADVNLRDGQGDTPLRLAVRARIDATLLVRELVGHGARLGEDPCVANPGRSLVLEAVTLPEVSVKVPATLYLPKKGLKGKPILTERIKQADATSVLGKTGQQIGTVSGQAEGLFMVENEFGSKAVAFRHSKSLTDISAKLCARGKEVRGYHDGDWIRVAGDVEELSPVLRALLELRAMPEGVDLHGRSPLMVAVDEGRETVTRALLAAKASAQVEDARGRSALVSSIAARRPSLALALLRASADPKKSCDQFGRRPLLMATHWGDEDVVRQLLAASALADDGFDAKGRAPLAVAVLNNRICIAEDLLASNANVCLTDKAGRNALHHCVAPLAYGSFENATLLRALVAAPGGTQAMATKDALGLTPVQMAAAQGSGRLLGVMNEEGASARAIRPSCLLAEPPENSFPAVQDHAQAEVQRVEATAKVLPTEPHPSYGMSGDNKVWVEDGQECDAMLFKVDLKRDEMRFYHLQLIFESNKDLYVLLTRWGEIGETGQFQRTPAASREEGFKEFCKVFKEKTGNIFQSLKPADQIGENPISQFEKKPNKYQILKRRKAVARSEDLLRPFLPDSQLPRCSLPYNLQRTLDMICDSGQVALAISNIGLKTDNMPFGCLSRDTLDQAKSLLGELRHAVKSLGEVKSLHEFGAKPEELEERRKKRNEIREFILDLSSRYFELVPRNVAGMELTRPLETERRLNDEFAALLDLAEASVGIQLLLGALHKQSSEHPLSYCLQGLGAAMERVDPASEEFAMVFSYTNATCSGMAAPEAAKAHDLPQSGEVEAYAQSIIDKRPVGRRPTRSANGRNFITGLYRVSRCGEELRFEAAGSSKDSNRRLLWHGSRLSNVIGILSQGLRVAPPEAPASGYMFGKGIYFADMFSKSYSYCRAQAGEPMCMFLCDVALGEMFPSKQAHYMDEPQPGTQSTWGQGKQSPEWRERLVEPGGAALPRGEIQQAEAVALNYNEFIVYDAAKVRIRYLVELNNFECPRETRLIEAARQTLRNSEERAAKKPRRS